MQKKLKSLFIVASLSLAASLAIVACGDGIPEILDDFLQDLGVSENYMNDKIEDVMDQSPEPPPPPISSEAPPSPGSSAAPPNPGSSAAPPNPGSSAAPNPGSSAGGTSSAAAPSSSSAPRSSAAPIAGNCVESKPMSNFNCGWDGYTNGAILTPGKVLKPATATPPSGCSVSWSYAPNTTDIAIMYDCEKVPDAGVTALGSKNYVLFAELTCDDGKHVNACNPKTGWSSKKAPELSGTCEWEKNPTTTARGGTPKKANVTVVDTDNVCGATKTVVYKYDDGTKEWPASGILPEWKNWDKKHEETYAIDAVLNCPAYSQTVAIGCPPLKVSAGSDYIIECTGKFDDKSCKVNSAAGNSVTLKADECVEINVMGYNDQYNLPNVIMRCETQGTQASASVSISLNGAAPTTTSGSWSVQPIVQLGKIKVGDNEFGNLCVTALSGATGLKCTGPSQ